MFPLKNSARKELMKNNKPLPEPMMSMMLCGATVI